MGVIHRLSLISFGCLALVSCSIDGDERCPAGFYWEEAYLSCVLVDSDTDIDAGADSGADDVDGGDGGGDTESSDEGFGTVCASDADCAAFTADFCNLNPLAPDDPGYCTIRDCAAGDCPAGYTCCDCRETILQAEKTACLTLAQAEIVSQPPVSCTCEN